MQQGPPAAEYHYDPAGKPDPFHPFVETELVLKKKSVSSIFPLQRVAIDQFNLVGIAGDAKHRLAIMEAKDGKGKYYPIAVGTVIGLNNGKVVEIRSDQIVIHEVENDSTGRKINKIIIKLHKDEEEGLP